MITPEQLEILRDIFAVYDDEWLLTHLSVQDNGHRNFTIEVDIGNSQDWEKLFPGKYPQENGSTD